MCDCKCIFERKVVGLEEELIATSLLGESSNEAIANDFLDTRRSRQTACSAGMQLREKLQAVFTDVLLTTVEMCAAVDWRLAWLKAISQRSYCLVIADVCRPRLDADPVPFGTDGAP